MKTCATGTKDIFGTTDRNNIIVYYSTDNQHWNYLDLTPGVDMGTYEPNYDPIQWQQNGILDLFYQQVPSSTNTEVSLLEWNERAFFASVPEPSTLVSWPLDRCLPAATGCGDDLEA